MIVGGTVSIALIIINAELPYGLDANVFGLSAAIFAYAISYFYVELKNLPEVK